MRNVVIAGGVMICREPSSLPARLWRKGEVRRLDAEQLRVDERGAVDIRPEPAAAIGWDVFGLCDPEEPAARGLLAGNIQSRR